MRLSGTKTGSANQYNGLGDQLYDLGGARPTLDLNFAGNGSLVDSVTGKTLVTHTRASNATYVDGDGIIKDAVTNLILRSEEFDNASWSKTRCSVSANQIASPNGSTTADYIVENSDNNSHFVGQTLSLTSGIVYTVSIYAKAGERSIFQASPSGAYLTTNGYVNYDLSSGTVTGSGGGATGSIVNVGNGWYRCITEFTANATASGTFAWFLQTSGTASRGASYQGDGSSGLYAWGAQLEEASTAGEYVKTTSTINSAPRFDHKVTRTTTNLALYSEEFDQWLDVESQVIINSSVAIAPDGTTTADKVVEDASTANHYVQSNHISVTGPVDITGSVFLKKGERRYVRLRLQTTAGPRAWFDLETGTRTAIDPAASDATITDVGNGWYRCTITEANVSTASNVSFQIFTQSDSGSQTSYTGDGTSGLYIWGAQVETNSDVGPYVKTEASTATKVDAEPLGLLVEESRTNLILRSEASVAYWGIAGTTTRTDVTDNAFGRFNGVRVTDDGQDWHGLNTSNFSATSGTAYAVTVFAKYGTASQIRVTFRDNSASTESRVQGSPGNLAVTSEFAGTISNVTEELQSDNTVKITFVVTANSTAPNIYIRVGPATSNNSDVIVYAAQVEEGSFPTSYIPTSGSTVTRSADVTSIEGNDFGTVNLAQYSEHVTGWNIKSNVNVLLDQETAPDGTRTADKVAENTATIEHYIEERVASGVSGVYTHSVFVKAAGRTSVYMRPVHVGESSNTSRCIFDLTAGTAGTPTDLASNPTIEAYPNGWYRISLSVTLTGANTTHGLRLHVYNGSTLNYQGDGTSGYFVWGAQIEESSTATPYVKSDVTWTSRASNATYYDYTGTLKKSSYNLITYSEQLDHSNWTDIGTSWTANAETAPDGTQTADNPGFIAAKWGIFDQTNLSWLSGYPENFPFTVTSTWTRRYITFTTPSGSTSARFYVLRDALDSKYVYQAVSGLTANTTYTASAYYKLADDNSTVLVWGAQLEAGPYAGDYAKTEASAASTARNVAFLPDGSGNFVSAGELLLEDAGTNYNNYSEYYAHDGSLGWYDPLGNATFTPNKLAPDGTLTAVEWKNTTSNQALLRDIHSSTTPNGTDSYTVSFWAKLMSQHNGQALRLDWNDVNVSNYTLELVTDEWVRITHSFVPSATAKSFVDIVSNTTSDAVIHFWGLQVEKSPYPTSYIPTFGSTATRAADVSSSSSNTFGNSFYDQTEGSVFADVFNRRTYDGVSSFPYILEFNDGTSNQRISFDHSVLSGGYRALFVVRDGNINQMATTVEYPIATGDLSLTGAYALNSFAASSNGNVAVIDSSGTVPVVNRLQIGNGFGIEYNGTISRLTYWPTRLSNDTLQTITV